MFRQIPFFVSTRYPFPCQQRTVFLINNTSFFLSTAHCFLFQQHIVLFPY
ncbi:hypothetical protein HMPREF1218_0557 [Hoylesella pleuritidis F0068]|uniref:Uncharacterized protein n=1 Tax=Hoylesella pleuritidis F0068 TaxID=1081904 RepID=U2KQ27_9BACT|nr:hypothetical protein HMPREF1218_0557 [Hoylesella pleuritidis F0068]